MLYNNILFALCVVIVMLRKQKLGISISIFVQVLGKYLDV